MTFSLMDADGGGTIDGENTIQRCDAACYCLTALLAMQVALLTTPSNPAFCRWRAGQCISGVPSDPVCHRSTFRMSGHCDVYPQGCSELPGLWEQVIGMMPG